eukprot:7064618-Pyramimonas_sp.AAC.2
MTVTANELAFRFPSSPKYAHAFLGSLNAAPVEGVPPVHLARQQCGTLRPVRELVEGDANVLVAAQ